MSRRALPLLLAAVAVVALVVLLTAAGPGRGRDDGAYRVRAIFDNAFGVRTGDEVRVAGARVGSVEDTDVTPDREAVLVLKIDDPAFHDFRADAECTVRPRAIIDERHVECLPTQPRGTGGTLPAALRTVRADGETQRLLPVSRTSRPVDLDLVVGMGRLPEGRRTAILVNELGVGLAARGGRLRRAVRAALPGLRETDRVLELLAGQRAGLRALATDADRALRPVAGERAALGDLIARGAELGTAVEERRGDLDSDLRRLPGTLAQFRPTARELSRVARQGAPVVRDLRRTAPAGARVLDALRPFGSAATGPVQDLGDTAGRARTTLLDADPAIRRLGRVATTVAPGLRSARTLTTSLRETGGFERLLDDVYLQVLAINAYDDVGHYLRINATVGPCSVYARTPLAGCSARYGSGAAARPAAGKAPRTGEEPEATLSRRVLAGESPASVLGDARGQVRYRGLLRRLDALAQRRGAAAPSTTSGRTPTRGADTPIAIEGDPVAAVAEPADQASRLFGYLLGTGD
ncbi:MlaD family protein [Patulibacter sp.]|uniref:MlaD family protein n=1 Tax=Patulibacter sp. TaxID=1912859 RepID=UPI002728E629|nr:MlaD family protein [Patulibacter sp.]MDO9408712.1 MlaD family protein [Patulibacter sp.]